MSNFQFSTFNFQFPKILTLILLLLTSCEKLRIEEETEQQTGNLTVSIYQLEQTPFSALSTRATLTETCTRLNFAIYDMEGTRLNQVNQTVGENNFGTASFQLEEGTYKLVAIAHSSKGNPTMTNPAKIQFNKSTGYSDTFLYHTTLTITDEPKTLALTLNRIVALCRFVINDEIPEDVKTLQFKYTGGSGTFDAATGLASTNGTQTLEFSELEGDAPTQYDLYTFLHDVEGTLHLTVTALDESNNTIQERTFEVPVKQNQITTLSGDFFTDVTPTSRQTVTTTVSLNTAWSGQTALNY